MTVKGNAAVDAAIEVQVSIRGLRTTTHPLWLAAVATGNWTLLAECRALASTLKLAAAQARRIAGLAEVQCPDGVEASGHGRAA